MKHVLLTFVSVTLVAMGAPAQAQLYPFSETDRVEMPELEPGAPVEGKLGWEVAMSGNTVFAAANQAFDRDGAVFVFEWDASGNLQLQQQLSTESETYKFGSQLVADGDWVAVSVIGSKIRMYQRSGASWVQRQLIEMDDVPDTPVINWRNLSGDLAMSGDVLVIGDTSAHVTTGSGVQTSAGAVAVLRRDSGGQWLHEVTLAADSPTASAGFGSAVAVSGDTLLVGASHEGTAAIFEHNGTQWQFAANLASPDTGLDFGWSVALDGDLAVVGRRSGFTGDGLPSNIGSFRAYERNLGGNGQWGLRGEYVSSEAGYIDKFSASMSLRGGVLLVGAPGSNRVVYFAHRPDIGFEEVAILALEDTVDPYGNSPNFGAAVAFSGLRTIVGAPSSPDQDVDEGSSGAERWGSIHAWAPDDNGECGHPFFPGDVIYCNGFEGVP